MAWPSSSFPSSSSASTEGPAPFGFLPRFLPFPAPFLPAVPAPGFFFASAAEVPDAAAEDGTVVSCSSSKLSPSLSPLAAFSEDEAGAGEALAACFFLVKSTAFLLLTPAGDLVAGDSGKEAPPPAAALVGVLLADSAATAASSAFFLDGGPSGVCSASVSVAVRPLFLPFLAAAVGAGVFLDCSSFPVALLRRPPVSSSSSATSMGKGDTSLGL